jgi:hypothetical protein
MKRIMFLAALAAMGAAANAAVVVTETMDENGAGYYQLNGASKTALTSYNGAQGGITYFYQTTYGWTAGDVVLTDANGVASDVLRFKSQQFYSGNLGDTITFYSLGLNGDKADVAALPTDISANAVYVQEIEGGLSYYKPGSSADPGWLNLTGYTTDFNFISSVPEPASWSWFAGLTAVVPLGWSALRSRRAK